MQSEFKDKIILVTGGTGTIGSQLVEHILAYEPKQIRVLSRDESKQYSLLERFNYPNNLRMLVGDIRDKERLDFAFRGVDIVFHAAALKHVPLCEYNPFEAVKTNIDGSQNVIDAALKNRTSKVIAISTDKVVNPVGVMGVSKLMMEKLFINANYYKGDAITKFSCVRFGNVAWSRGSVLNLWKEQADKEGVIKVTSDRMTRFMMSRNEAVDLVSEATRLMDGGEIFVFKMPSINMMDFARLFINKYYAGQNIRIDIIGNRGGEKLHEELLGNSEEDVQILENNKMLIITPRIYMYGMPKREVQNDYEGFREVTRRENYSSEHNINIEKIVNIL